MSATAQAMAQDSRNMTAQDVRDCLAIRWPASEYLMIEEAPDSADRGGRKLDVLAISLWQSRGFQLDGVEVKVSMSDWRRELQNAQKADWWWRHVNRFWVAVPEHMVVRVAGELPPGWGLLACESGKAPRVASKPEAHEAEAMPWSACIGLMRASSNAGRNALFREYARGKEDGRKAAKEQAAKMSPDEWVRRDLQRLKDCVAAFEQASGISIGDEYTAQCNGNAVRLIRQRQRMPEMSRQIQHVAGMLERNATEARELAKALDTIAEVPYTAPATTEE